jgi:hypothetical protein
MDMIGAGAAVAGHTREALLEAPQPCDHAAHLYVDPNALFDAVARYAGAAARAGEAAIVVATAGHHEGILNRLELSGCDCSRLLASGQLVCIDAEDRLAQIMDGRTPDSDVFHAIVRELLDTVQSRYPRIRIYGEMVNRLWHRGNLAAANRIEEWWNGLIKEYGFSLLCGYRVSVFDYDDAVQAGLTSICHTHSHLIPVHDYALLDRAVDAALREVINKRDVSELKRELAERCRRRAHMPPAQAALFALRDVLPSLAKDVRMLAREHYDRAPV